jgi:RNA polymerase sigma-70 factor (ECF subfamily)
MNNEELDFQIVHETFRPKIQRYLSRIIGEYEAEDLTQEVFVKVSKGLENYRGESKLSTWIYRIATNAAIDRMRSSSFQKLARKEISERVPENGETDEMADKEIRSGEKVPTVEKQLVRKEMNECIREFIENLPETYRLVLVLIDLEGLKNKEVAEILGVSLGTVKIRIHRAREKLKQELISHCDAYWIEGNEFIPDLKEALEEFREPGQT